MDTKIEAVSGELEPDATGSASESDETQAVPTGPRTRRALLTGAAAAAGALAVDAILRPSPAAAADVVLGGTNNTTTPTIVQNTTPGNSTALVGRLTDVGSAPNSAALWGDAKGAGAVALQGTANNGTGARGVLGQASSGTGVKGLGGHTGVIGGGTTQGVKGTSTNGYGVFGESTNYIGVYATGGYGAYGVGTSAGIIGTSTDGYGLYGIGSIGGLGVGDGAGYGLWGYNADSSGYGVVGQGGYRGIYGSGGNAGVYGTSGYVGLWGNASTTSGLNFGVYGYSGSSGGYAGVFSGAVQVSGYLSKLGGGFKIDHPLEPDKRYLIHSFVEAPEMLNVYSGTAKLSSSGQATVKLPGYFSAENRDFRYQLTALGAPAPNLHVSAPVASNSFKIAGGAAGQQVCWQVTGVRQDAWAKAHPIEVEQLKDGADQGKYLAPEAHGRPKEDGIFNLQPPDGDKVAEKKPDSLPALAKPVSTGD